MRAIRRDRARARSTSYEAARNAKKRVLGRRLIQLRRNTPLRSYGTRVVWQRRMKRSIPLFALGLACAILGGCGSADAADEAEGSSEEALTGSFTSKGTGYYPSSSALEGGFVDRKGAKLRTLQQFLAGQASYVSVAMDSNAFPYGQHLRIKELEEKYGRAIDFRVVDTGGAFRGRGRTRIDICVANRSASLDASINRTLHIDAVNSFSPTPSPAPTPTTPAPSPPPSPSPAPPDDDDAPSGPACTSDGQCNPGNDGSGMICTAGHCTAGCRSNAQCPGSTQCTAGQCR
jgi:3D (Asp-Asp-Asp) domain-containing protein